MTDASKRTAFASSFCQWRLDSMGLQKSDSLPQRGFDKSIEPYTLAPPQDSR